MTADPVPLLQRARVQVGTDADSHLELLGDYFREGGGEIQLGIAGMLEKQLVLVRYIQQQVRVTARSKTSS